MNAFIALIKELIFYFYLSDQSHLSFAKYMLESVNHYIKNTLVCSRSDARPPGIHNKRNNVFRGRKIFLGTREHKKSKCLILGNKLHGYVHVFIKQTCKVSKL